MVLNIISLFVFTLTVSIINGSPTLRVATTKEDKEAAYNAMYGNGNSGGDMVFSPRQKSALKTRNAWPNVAQRWTGGIVPYVLDSSATNLQYYVSAASQHIASLTGNCINIRPRNGEADYVRISSTQKGCYSFIGRQGGAQDLNLGSGCAYFGIVVHELLHAIGFAHEQNRNDRDNYITIYPSNIQTDQLHNFQKLSNGITYTGFDYNSIMLYGEYAFTKSRGSKTMEDKNRRFTLTEPYEKYTMTAADAYEVKRYYNCRV